MRWEGHVARTEKRKVQCRVLVAKHEGRNHLKEQGVDGRIMLK
jgi:hypothetical protein